MQRRLKWVVQNYFFDIHAKIPHIERPEVLVIQIWMTKVFKNNHLAMERTSLEDGRSN